MLLIILISVLQMRMSGVGQPQLCQVFYVQDRHFDRRALRTPRRVFVGNSLGTQRQLAKNRI